MSRRPARFTQADIHRALKAAEQAGAQMTLEILPDGTIRLNPAVHNAGVPAPMNPGRGVERKIVL